MSKTTSPTAAGLPHLKDSDLRLSFHIKSPLLKHKAASPTFRISFSEHRASLSKLRAEKFAAASSPLPDLAYTNSLDTNESSLPASLPRSASVAGTSNGPTAAAAEDDDLIASQLEALEQLFPKEVKTYSGEFAKSPATLSAKASRSSIESQGQVEDPTSPSVGSSRRTSRSSQGHRSNTPSLSVNTVTSQAYATKELVLIRKLKEENRVKREEKDNAKQAAKATQKPAAVEAAPPPSKVTAKPASPRFPFPVMASDKQAAEQPAKAAASVPAAIPRSLAAPAASRHLRGMSTDTINSMNSGIVWSAVVEKFSEMAEEIAGKPKSALKHSNLASEAVPSSAPLMAEIPVNSSRDKKSPRKHEPAKLDDVEEVGPTGTATPLLALSATLDDLAQLGSAVEMTSPFSQSEGKIVDAADDSAAIVPPVASPSQYSQTLGSPRSQTGSDDESDAQSQLPLSPVKMKRRSKSLLASAMRKRTEDDEDEDDTASLHPDGASRKFARKARNVRIVSTHVEGDYAAFLQETKEKQNESPKDIETASKISKMSKGTGVENGLFRRGSMRSILTGKTIATVGGVSIKDLSRGARFRKPSPFFACGHGYRKVHGPFLAFDAPKRKVSLLRKGSLLNKKRQSVEVEESLLTTMARLREQKRDAEKPLLGAMAFEPGAESAPAAPISKTSGPPAPVHARTLPLPNPSLIGKPYAQSAFAPASKKGYAQTAFTPGSSKAGSSAPSGQMSLNASNLAALASGSGSRPPGSSSTIQRGYSSSDTGAGNGAKPFGKMMPPRMGSSSGHSVAPSAMPGSMPSRLPSSAVGITKPMAAGSAMSLIAASRQQVKAQSNVSVASNRSGRNRSNSSPQPPPSRSNSDISPMPVPSQRSAVSALSASRPGGSSAGQATNQSSNRGAPPANSQQSLGASQRTPPKQPVPALPNSFISMTPARSELSVKSARSAEAVNAIAANIVGSSGVPPLPPSKSPRMSSVVQPPHLQRSSTAPVPGLPQQFVQQPLRKAGSHGHEGQGQPQGQERTQSHRPNPALSVDTEIARQNQRMRDAARQQAQQPLQMPMAPPRQVVASPENMDTYAARAARSVPDHGNMPSAAPPRSASSLISNVFSSGPKRPVRDSSEAPVLDTRKPRPPSVQPASEGLDNFGGKTGKNSGAALKKVFGFGKKKN